MLLVHAITLTAALYLLAMERWWHKDNLTVRHYTIMDMTGPPRLSRDMPGTPQGSLSTPMVLDHIDITELYSATIDWAEPLKTNLRVYQQVGEQFYILNTYFTSKYYIFLFFFYTHSCSWHHTLVHGPIRLIFKGWT